MFLNFIESLVNLIKFIKLDIKEKDFVFYSESKFYRNYYLDLIISLKRENQKNIILVTSDKEDVIFFKDTVKCIYIKNFFLLIIFFKTLNSKFMIMTLTDLGAHFQKSKKCKYYVYYFHAIASTFKIYTNTAFRNYDSIFSNGNYQAQELRLIEKEYDFPKKEIVNTGYFLDNIKSKANINTKEDGHILCTFMEL